MLIYTYLILINNICGKSLIMINRKNYYMSDSVKSQFDELFHTTTSYTPGKCETNLYLTFDVL